MKFEIIIKASVVQHDIKFSSRTEYWFTKVCLLPFPLQFMLFHTYLARYSFFFSCLFCDLAPRWRNKRSPRWRLSGCSLLTSVSICCVPSRQQTEPIYSDRRERCLQQDWHVCFVSLTRDSVLSSLR